MEKAGRNDPCPCGSGKKFKKCCEEKLPRKRLGAAQWIGGSSKMSSLFNRQIVPLQAPNPKPASSESAPSEENRVEEGESPK